MSDRPLYYQSPMPQGPLAEGQVILRDGSTAQLRRVEASDRELLESFLQNVSREARSRRFFGEVSPESGAEQLLKQGPPSERLSLVVVSGDADKQRVIAHGTYIRDAPGADAAEVAFIVDDSVYGKGLGTLLLERLALVAVREGIEQFYGPTEATNRMMRDLFREIGFPVTETRDGSYVNVRFSISPSKESVERFEMRERIATVASLHPFFKPRSVAVVGASRDPDSIGYRILRYLVMSRFSGPVYPVNPSARVVGSMPAYASLDEISGDVDLAVVAVPMKAVAEVVDACGVKGVRSLVVVSAGFAETGAEGRARQDALLAKARGYGMRLVGPNCLGLLNTHPEVRLNASFSPVFPPHGPVAMASQSGALGLAVLELASGLGLGLSSFVSLGNTADVSGNDLIQYWEDDPDTSVILLYLEAFGNPRRFARLARRIGRRKPILVVKAGRSHAGGRAASSHTAALSASDTATEALFHQAGIIRADTLEEMFDAAALLAGQPLPDGDAVGIVTNAGGPAILAVDALAAEGLSMPAPTEATRDAMAAVLPSSTSLANPVDMIASASAAQYREVVELMLRDPAYGALLILFIPVGLAETEAVAAAICEAVVAARSDFIHKPVLACFMAEQGVSDALSPEGEHIPSYRFPEAAAKALGRVAAYARWRTSPTGIIPDYEGLDIDRARDLVRHKAAEGGGWLSAEAVSEVLSAFGLPRVPGRVARSAEEAAELADTYGYPVAVKLASDRLVHKSDWNGVHLNVRDAEAVRSACRDIEQRLGAADRKEDLSGFLVQPMILGGVELVVGMTDDELFGPLMVFGLGGVHVEILRDVVFRITPLTDRDVEDMVTGIKGYPLLQGYRGMPEADIPAIKDVLLRVSRLVEELPELAELDLNPLKALEPGQGCVILDARIRVEGA